jgi:hypothetical protein
MIAAGVRTQILRMVKMSPGVTSQYAQEKIKGNHTDVQKEVT